MTWTLFVEGPSDKVFIEWLLRGLQGDEVEVKAIGGGVSKLEFVKNEIHRRHDAGRHVAVLLDADDDIQGRRNALAAQIDSLGLPVEKTFLLPDNTDPGDLETLLERMAPPAHEAVYRCFDDYEACLRRHDPAYTVPNRKARVYAYCEAVGAETGPNKDYDKAEHWNAAAPLLKPLRRFLRSMAGGIAV